MENIIQRKDVSENEKKAVVSNVIDFASFYQANYAIRRICTYLQRDSSKDTRDFYTKHKASFRSIAPKLDVVYSIDVESFSSLSKILTGR